MCDPRWHIRAMFGYVLFFFNGALPHEITKSVCVMCRCSSSIYDKFNARVYGGSWLFLRKEPAMGDYTQYKLANSTHHIPNWTLYCPHRHHWSNHAHHCTGISWGSSFLLLQDHGRIECPQLQLLPHSGKTETESECSKHWTLAGRQW